MEIGCAQIATIITTHLEHGATGEQLKYFLSSTVLVFWAELAEFIVLCVMLSRLFLAITKSSCEGFSFIVS
jgi:hypothetical protein